MSAAQYLKESGLDAFVVAMIALFGFPILILTGLIAFSTLTPPSEPITDDSSRYRCECLE